MEQTQDIQSTIVGLWKRVDRPGVDRLTEFLCNSDFFIAPCSTQYHLAEPGGLAHHSLNVYQHLIEKVDRYGIDVPLDSIIICGLGHDLCKVNFYKVGGEPCSDAQYNYLCSLWSQKSHLVQASQMEALSDLLNSDGQFVRSTPATHATLLIDWLKNRPSEGCPRLPRIWIVNDELPLGHGEKSVIMLQNYIRLTPNEQLAIRWHMVAFDPGIHFDYPSGYAFRAASKRPLVVLLHTADYEASQLLEISTNQGA